jgi:hypothetical protein
MALMLSNGDGFNDGLGGGWRRHGDVVFGMPAAVYVIPMVR